MQTIPLLSLQAKAYIVCFLLNVTLIHQLYSMLSFNYNKTLIVLHVSKLLM